MIKQIFAIVSDNDFYRIRRKAYFEHRTLGEALTALAIAYGKGEIDLSDKKKQEQKDKKENAYLKDHKGGK